MREQMKKCILEVNQKRAVRRALVALETMAEVWAAEVGLHHIAMKLSDAPIDQRASAFRAMMIQAFIEGAYRHFLDHESGKCVGHTPEKDGQ